MKFVRLTTVLGAIALFASPALATTITNQGQKEHTLTVDHGVKQSDQNIAAGDSVKVDCPDGCGFRVQGMGYGRQTDNDGKLVIDQKGMLRFASEAAAGGTAKPNGKM